MVDLSTAGDSGDFRDTGGRRSAVPVGNETVDGGVEQTRAHGGAAFGLRSPNGLTVDAWHHFDCTFLSDRPDSAYMLGCM
ncbi:hypothetical protein MFM001_34050 [Mycobacterium sp. MFM001]|nr:hypothetical protein MFM001_34050 [Mycobacterium sp. MFM001]